MTLYDPNQTITSEFNKMLINQLIKYVALTAFLLLSLLTRQAQAWVFTTSGTISSGYDSSGVFGTAGADLTGLSYTQAITVDPAQYAIQVSTGTGQSGSDTLPISGTATDTVTVNGVTQSYIFDLTQTNFGQSILTNYLTQASIAYDQAYQYQRGATANGQYIWASGDLSSNINAFNLSLSYTQSWSYSVQTGDSASAYFQISSAYNSNASFYPKKIS